MTETFSFNKDGKEYSFAIPVLPKGVVNGSKLIGALKRYLKKHASSKRKCMKAISAAADVLNAPRADWLTFEMTWVKHRIWGYNPKCRVHMCGKGTDGERYGNFSNGSASGCGYDKKSAALHHAVHGKQMKSMFKRMILEGMYKLKAANQFSLQSNCMTNVSDYDFIPPDVAFDGAGMGEFNSIMKNLGWKCRSFIDGDMCVVGEYYKPSHN